MNNLESIFPFAYRSGSQCVLYTPSTDRIMLDDFSSIPDTIQCTLFPKMLNNELIRQFIHKRALNLIMLRTVNVTCQRNLPNNTCPSSPSLDASMLDTRPIGSGYKSYSNYGTADANGINFNVRINNKIVDRW